MARITNFSIDESNISGSATKRAFNIGGDIGSEFILQIVSSENKFYNFKSNTFTAANVFDSENVLRKTLVSANEKGLLLKL